MKQRFSVTVQTIAWDRIVRNHRGRVVWTGKDTIAEYDVEFDNGSAFAGMDADAKQWCSGGLAKLDDGRPGLTYHAGGYDLSGRDFVSVTYTFQP